VWDHRDLLTGSDEALGGLGAKPEDRRKQYEAILELADRSHREPVEAILTRMFPRFASALGGAQHGPEWEAQWRGKLRVCSADIFPIYFRLAVPTGGISTARMRSILALGADSEAFESALIRLAGERRPDGTSRARVFLERMEDYTADKIPADHVEPIVRAFFNAGDALVIPEDEVGFFAIGNDMRVGRIVRQLLMRLSGEEQRFQVLSRVLPGARALYTVVDRVRVFKQEHEEKGKQTPGRPEHECTVGEQHLEQLRDMALQRVQEAAAEGALAEAAHLGSVLYAWREWAGEEAPQQYAAEATSTDEGLALFLERFLRAVRSQSIEDSVGRVEWRVRPKAVGHFVEDTAGLCERASEILNVAPPWLTERQRTALSAFVDECLNPDKFRFD